MVFKIPPETSAIDHHFLTSNLRSINDHQICVSKLVNGLQNFSRNFSDRSLFFNTKFAINHQIWVSKLVNGVQNFSRNFSDRSLFFYTKCAIDHQICVSKLVNGLQNFSRNFSDRSPDLGVKVCLFFINFLNQSLTNQK